MTLNQHKTNGTTFFDKRRCLPFKIYKIFADHKVNHVRVIYMRSVDGKHKQQFTEIYFNALLLDGQIEIQ